jgi:hypothetical protein
VSKRQGVSREKVGMNALDKEIKSVYCRFYDKLGSFKQKLASWIEDKTLGFRAVRPRCGDRPSLPTNVEQN